MTPIVVEQIFERTIPDVWNAITQLELMQQWFFKEIEEFKPEEGFETQFLIEVEGRKYTHLWKITEVIPNKKIVYSWKYEEFEGESQVIFEVFDFGDKTKLQLTNLGLETFPNDVPEFTRESCQAGWHYFIKERLSQFLNTKA